MPIDHTDNVIEVQDISFAYGAQPVLEHITFSVHRGDYLGMIGPNGGGKTTLLKIMLGILRPAVGEVRIFGEEMGRFRAWHRLGYVPQKAAHIDAQFPATAREVVAMGRTARRGIGRRLDAEDRAAIDEALSQVDMAAHRDRRIGELSPGQQQRVLIARALASKPDILFLDEPTVGVDSAAQEQFYALLKTLNQSLGLTLILVSHDIDVVASQATEIACINCRLVCHCPPAEFNASEYIRHLYGKDIKFIVHHDH